MNNDVAIKVSCVSKKFSRNLKSLIKYGFYDIGRSILGMTIDSSKLRKDEFWAVENVSFEIKKGEALGIIGHNGSGKSTILKMLNGIYMPDIGKIEINNRVGALIEVAAGFHPMLTGRENIYVNGAILGMTKKEIEKKFDDIVNFADIGDFIDSPVRNYSSGMYVKLGFSVAAHSEPEILLIDEILAVGDLKFQAKCLDHLSILRKKGVTTVLVSHHMPKIGSFCDRVLMLSKGRMKVLGEPEVAIEMFEKEMYYNNNTCSVGAVPASNPIGGAELSNVIFHNKIDDKVNLRYGDPVKISLEYDLMNKEIEDCCIAVIAYRKKDGLRCFGVLSSDQKTNMRIKTGKMNIIINGHNLLPGEYVIDVQVRSKQFDRAYFTYREKNVVISYPDYYILKNLAGVYQPHDVEWSVYPYDIN